MDSAFLCSFARAVPWAGIPVFPAQTFSSLYCGALSDFLLYSPICQMILFLLLGILSLEQFICLPHALLSLHCGRLQGGWVGEGYRKDPPSRRLCIARTVEFMTSVFPFSKEGKRSKDWKRSGLREDRRKRYNSCPFSDSRRAQQLLENLFISVGM